MKLVRMETPQRPLLQVVHSTGWVDEADAEDEQLRLQARELAEDPMNREIIRRLQDDGRVSFSQIARELGTSEPTVRNRVNRMIDTRLMRIIAVVDPVSLGHNVYAMIGLKLSAGSDPRVTARSFVDCGEVTYVLFGAGRYDLMIEVICPDQDAFRKFVLERCYGNPQIALIEPMMGLQLFKSLMKWGRP
jgi:Lrp/AsnC family transcriptional regulator for asnA, asnC and gidA